MEIEMLAPEIKAQLNSEFQAVAKKAFEEALETQALNKRVLNKAQACKYLGISYPTLRRLRKAGKIKAFILAGTQKEVFDIRDLERYVEESKVKI